MPAQIYTCAYSHLLVSHPIDHSAHYSAKPQFLLVIGSCLTVLAIIGIVTYLLIRERGAAEQAAARSANNIVQLIDADVLRNVELYDLSLQGLIAAAQRDDLTQVSPQIRHLVLFDRAAGASHKGDILLLDAHGNVLADSASLEPRSGNYADREYFQFHVQNRTSALFISPPFVSRLPPHDWRIAFSRRLSSSNGEFLGVAEASMHLSYFNELFRNLNIGPDSSINLLSSEGFLLAQQPARQGDSVGKDFSQRPNFIRILREGDGSFTGISAVDGRERLYTFSQVGQLPLVVVVALSTEELYAGWKRSALLVGSATAILCIGLLWLTLMLCRELLLRQRAEQRLERLASTDALTGLANRRTLDQTLRTECARAQRTGSELSLLMIDVDHFKAFNDRHGHPLGDQALRQVAQVIKDCIRRPADLATRYGGEEFCVVLPDTDPQGALRLAETIRSSIAGLSPYADDEQGISASIGVSTLSASGSSASETLVKAADRALYLAKRSGRNRVVHANETL